MRNKHQCARSKQRNRNDLHETNNNEFQYGLQRRLIAKFLNSGAEPRARKVYSASREAAICQLNQKDRPLMSRLLSLPFR
jgi:hypothetical protein